MILASGHAVFFYVSASAVDLPALWPTTLDHSIVAGGVAIPVGACVAAGVAVVGTTAATTPVAVGLAPFSFVIVLAVLFASAFFSQPALAKGRLSPMVANFSSTVLAHLLTGQSANAS